MDSAISSSSSHWCYNCSRFVNVNIEESVLCCDCQGGFVEQIDNPPPQSQSQSAIPAAMLVLGTNSTSNSNNRGWFGFLRRRNRVDGLPYNPIIALRGPSVGGNGGVEGRSIGFYSYEGGVLQPLPSNESDLLISSGFHHHLDGWANIAVSALGNRPASKAAVESMATVEIVEDHVVKESHCAVCKEDFEIGCEAKEMPCKHIYHLDCIQPWLSMRNTCPLCRHELPTAASVAAGSQDEQLAVPGEENNGAFGLVIWRLPTRSLAVVRFSGGRPEAERLISFFTSSMETSTGVPIELRARESSGGRGLFQRVSSLFRRNRSSSGDSAQQSTPARSAQQNSPANDTAM